MRSGHQRAQPDWQAARRSSWCNQDETLRTSDSPQDAHTRALWDKRLAPSALCALDVVASFVGQWNAIFIGQWRSTLGHCIHVESSNGVLVAQLTKPGGSPLALPIILDSQVQRWRCGNGFLDGVRHDGACPRRSALPVALSWVTADGRLSTWTRRLLSEGPQYRDEPWTAGNCISSTRPSLETGQPSETSDWSEPSNTSSRRDGCRAAAVAPVQAPGSRWIAVVADMSSFVFDVSELDEVTTRISVKSETDEPPDATPVKDVGGRSRRRRGGRHPLGGTMDHVQPTPGRRERRYRY